jgi:hypothetical protein
MSMRGNISKNGDFEKDVNVSRDIKDDFSLTLLPWRKLKKK